jgi:hypothetical protein
VGQVEVSRVRYRAEPGWEEQLRAQPTMVKSMNGRAKVVAKTAKAIAPVDETGDYKRLIYASGPRVYAHDFAWHWVEFGSVHNAAKAPLRRGTIAAGLTFIPHPPPA